MLGIQQLGRRQEGVCGAPGIQQNKPSSRERLQELLSNKSLHKYIHIWACATVMRARKTRTPTPWDAMSGGKCSSRRQYSPNTSTTSSIVRKSCGHRHSLRGQGNHQQPDTVVAQLTQSKSPACETSPLIDLLQRLEATLGINWASRGLHLAALWVQMHSTPAFSPLQPPKPQLACHENTSIRRVTKSSTAHEEKRTEVPVRGTQRVHSVKTQQRPLFMFQHSPSLPSDSDPRCQTRSVGDLAEVTACPAPNTPRFITSGGGGGGDNPSSFTPLLSIIGRGDSG